MNHKIVGRAARPHISCPRCPSRRIMQAMEAEPTKADQPSRRRRFQFRLRTLLIAVTLLAVACWAGSKWRDHLMAERYYLKVRQHKGRAFAQTFDGHVWIGWQSGPPISDEELDEIRWVFPQAYVVQNDGTVLQGRRWP
jgi:hypothetical protein